MNNDELNIQGEHGEFTKNIEKGKKFLTNYDYVTMLLFILLVILGAFWYDVIRDIFRYIFNVDKLNFYQNIIAALSITVIAYIIVTRVFKVPFAALVA